MPLCTDMSLPKVIYLSQKKIDYSIRSISCFNCARKSDLSIMLIWKKNICITRVSQKHSIKSILEALSQIQICLELVSVSASQQWHLWMQEDIHVCHLTDRGVNEVTFWFQRKYSFVLSQFKVFIYHSSALI